MPLRFPEMLTVCGIEEDVQGSEMVIFSLVRIMAGQESIDKQGPVESVRKTLGPQADSVRKG